MPAPQNLPLRGDQARSDGDAALGGALLCFFEGGLEPCVALHVWNKSNSNFGKSVGRCAGWLLVKRLFKGNQDEF